MARALRRIFGEIATYWSPAGTILGWIWTIGGGAMTAWATWATGIFARYAPLSWIVSGLAGAICAAAAITLFGLGRYLLVRAGVTAKWGERTQIINPLDPEFNHKIIRIGDLAHPMTRAIKQKRFINCEIFGPANLLPRRNVMMTFSNFNNCDCILVNEQFAANTLVSLEEVHVISCTFWNCTLFVPPPLEKTFREMGAKFINEINENVQAPRKNNDI